MSSSTHRSTKASGTGSSTSKSSTRASTVTTASTTSAFTPTPTSILSSTTLDSAVAASGTTTSIPSFTSNASAGNKPPVVAIVLGAVFGVLALGAIILAAIFLRRRRIEGARQRFAQSSFIIGHEEPKRSDSYPQLPTPDSMVYFSKPGRDSADTLAKSYTSYDQDYLQSPHAKVRSSRASSSIISVDNATVTSHSNFLPLSTSTDTVPFAKRSMPAGYTVSSQPLPLYERFGGGTDPGKRLSFEQRLSPVPSETSQVPDRASPSSVRVTPPPGRVSQAPGRLSPIPGTPATPGIIFAPAPKESAPLDLRKSVQLAPTISITSSPPPQSLPIPRPAPTQTSNMRVPSQYSTNSVYRQSVASVYSTQSQVQPMEFSNMLSTDVMNALENLKPRASYRFSAGSQDTYHFNKSEEA